jgi:ubiquinone/menaquinone biosynthesis C-methylase UbiE
MTFESLLRERSANDYAAFFSAHVRESDDVLDCGCGAGSITVGLAGHVRTGSVVGIDVSSVEFEDARAYAKRNVLTNLTFCAADLLHLPFSDESFSAAFCHSALEMLQDPIAALAEIRRVLRPGGLIGVACVEYEGVVIAGPNENLLRRFYTIREELWQREGPSNPRLGKRLRSLLHRAGYERVSAHLAYFSYGTDERIAKFGADRAQECGNDWYAEAASRHHLLTPADLAEMAGAWETWATSADAFFGFTWSRAIGWKHAP